MRIEAVIADLDNTIYNFNDYFAPCFRAMLHYLSKELKVDEPTLVSQFQQIYIAEGSMEYPFSIQRLPACNGLSTERVRELTVMGQKAFRFVRRKRLKPYDTVPETLTWLRQQGFRVIAATNGIVDRAWRRIIQLGLKSSFDGIAGRTRFEFPPNDPIAAEFLPKRQARNKLVPKYIWEFPPNDLKPSNKMYSAILSGFGLDPIQVMVVGDSLERDIAPALRLGMYGVWARYGKKCELKNAGTIRALTTWSADKEQKERDTTVVLEPPLVIDSFAELLKVVTPRQGSLLNLERKADDNFHGPSQKLSRAL